MPRILRGQQAGFVTHVINEEMVARRSFIESSGLFWLAPVPNVPRACPEFYRRVQSLALRSSRGISPFRAVPIIQPLCSVQNISESLKIRKVQRTQVGGHVAIEPLSLRHNRCPRESPFSPGHPSHITHRCYQKKFVAAGCTGLTSIAQSLALVWIINDGRNHLERVGL